MLINAQHTVVVLSSLGSSPSFEGMTKSMGCVACNMEYFCRRLPITQSIRIRAFAICRVCSTLMPLSWVFLLVNAGILIVAKHRPTESTMLKPLSARIMSPGVSLDRSPLFSVTSLSLALPLHPLEMKHTVPCGVIPMRCFTAL